MKTEKPWDMLRTKPRIGDGSWYTEHDAVVTVRFTNNGDVELSTSSDTAGYMFRESDLRQLAEFCNELAAQLEGADE